MADNPVTDENNVVLYDDLGNKVGVILDGSIYRLAGSNIVTNAGGGKIVTVSTDGAKERLDVDAQISGGAFQIQPFTPVVDFDSTGIALTTAWTTLVTETGEGKLDFIACSVGSSNYKVRLTIDTNVIFDISMADLNAIGLTNAVNINIWAETALKNFRYRPFNSVDYVMDMKIEAAMTAGTGTLYYLITHRTLS